MQMELGSSGIREDDGIPAHRELDWQLGNTDINPV